MKSEFDVVVVGSGASGMTAALAAAKSGSKVVLIEKNSRFGGSSSLSGGQIWIPNNTLQKEYGIKDSPEMAIRYIKKISMGRSKVSLIRTFVEKAPEALDFLIRNTPIRPVLRVEEPDYRPELEGALKGGRTLDPGLFDGDTLGNEYKNILHNPQYHFMGRHVTSIEFEKIMRGEEIAELKERKSSTLALGEALVGALRKALLDMNVPILLSCRATKLLLEGRRVNGLEAMTRKGKSVFYCRKAVILAAGGFEWNRVMKRKYLEFYSENSAGCTSNTGDGIRMGISVGASTNLMDQAWWFTLIKKPGEKRGYLSTSERTLPGSIIVNKNGRRFANEAMNYNDLVREMIKVNVYKCMRENVPSFLVFDSTYASKYTFLGLRRIPGWVKRDNTLAGLGKKLGINQKNLVLTVEKFNKDAAKGKDTDFGRGESFYDKHWGDSTRDNPTISPLDKPPFYGVRMLAGDIGTKGGLSTNIHSQVLDSEEKPIEGLYAAGNNASSIMGLGYAGSGATLGPCITFGYIAGMHASKTY